MPPVIAEPVQRRVMASIAALPWLAMTGLAVAVGLSAYREAVSFMLMLAVLLVRPQGLLGARD